MAGKVIREGKGEGGHAEQRWQAKRASRIHKRSGAALRGRVMSPCSKHTFVCAYFMFSFSWIKPALGRGGSVIYTRDRGCRGQLPHCSNGSKGSHCQHSQHRDQCAASKSGEDNDQKLSSSALLSYAMLEVHSSQARRFALLPCGELCARILPPWLR